MLTPMRSLLVSGMATHHEAIEEHRELGVSVKRQHVCNILTRPHHNDAALIAIDAAHGEDIVTALEVGAEHLFIVAKSEASLAREQEIGHGFERKLAMRLLEDGADIDYGIDLGSIW